MIVRRIFSVVVALCALLAGAGCGDRGGTPLTAETDEPFYVQGKQLVKQGRNPEALTYFLKVIDRRGERGAPESHLEAGNIYLFHSKEPVEAYHHFRRYLDLQPNSKEAARVRGMVQAAVREFAATLPTRPLDDQSMKLQAEETITKLQRENEELRAQIATLRGGGAMPIGRAAPMIALPEESDTRPAIPTTGEPPVAVAPATRAAPTPGPMLKSPVVTPPGKSPAVAQPAPARAAPPTRPSTPGGRTHTVAVKETIYGISVKYYGNGRQVEAIYQANRDVMRSPTDVRPGMTLRIPALDAGAGRR